MSDDCPADVKVAADTECREKNGDCDVAEVCDGMNDDCPADAKATAETPCEDGDECTSAEGDPGTPDQCDGNGMCTPGIPVDCEFSISTSFSGPNVEVTILLQTLDDGSGVEITVDVTDSTLIGDIQGVFFHVND